MSLALDVLTVLVFVVLIVSSWRKGLVRTVIEFAGYIAALVVSFFLSAPAGNWIYGILLKPMVSSRVASYADSLTGSGAVQAGAAGGTAAANGTAAAASMLNSIPAQLRDLFASYHLSPNLLQDAGNAVKSGGNAVLTAMLNALAAPIALTVSRVLAFVVIFALCMVGVRFIANLTDPLFRIPVVGTLNRLGGAAVGTLKALLLMFLIAVLISAVLPVVSLQKDPPVTQQTIQKTTVFKYLYNGNPLSQMLLKSR